jgi:hypothetical protein
MSVAHLVDRLAALPRLSEVPPEELEWLVVHGNFEAHDAGYVIGPIIVESRPGQPEFRVSLFVESETTR